MPKYIEVPKVDHEKAKVKKRVTFFLFLSVISCVSGVILTAIGFIHYGWLIAALAFEVITPVAMLLAFRETMRYGHGGKSKDGK